MATFEQDLKLMADFCTWDRGTCEYVRDELIPNLKKHIRECEDCDAELMRVGEPAMFASDIEEWKQLMWSAVAKLMHAGYVTPNDKAQGAGGGFIAGGSPGAAGSAADGEKL